MLLFMHLKETVAFLIISVTICIKEYLKRNKAI